MTKISKETREFYHILKDVGEFKKGGDYEDLSGDWETDKVEFNRRYKSFKKIVREIETKADEI